jgi:hypothetical protein
MKNKLVVNRVYQVSLKKWCQGLRYCDRIDVKNIQGFEKAFFGLHEGFPWSTVLTDYPHGDC